MNRAAPNLSVGEGTRNFDAFDLALNHAANAAGRVAAE